MVKCNTGLQRCVGGCTHCMTVDGSFVAKSCAGEHDVTLSMLGVYADGCKNITNEQNHRYADWLMDSIGRKMQLRPNFTHACRCSWNGCNGIPTLDLMKMPHFIFQKYNKQAGSSAGRSMNDTTLTTVMLIIFCIFRILSFG